VVVSGIVVVVVAVLAGVVVVTGGVVVVVVVTLAFTMASVVAVLGAVGVTPVGSKAMVIRNSGENLMVAEFVVVVGFFCEIDDQ
jgi:hypothetical protein